MIAIHPDWAEHPLVREAARDADDALGLLTQLNKLMLEVEDRFPGVPYRQILEQPQAALGKLDRIAMLRDAGIDEDLIADLEGPVDIEHGWGEREWTYAATDLSYSELQELSGWSRGRCNEVVALRGSFTGNEDKVIEAVQAGATISEAARLVGVARNTARRAVRKWRYAAWSRSHLAVTALAVVAV
jgi:hypothetical protein